MEICEQSKREGMGRELTQKEIINTLSSFYSSSFKAVKF